MKKIITLIYYLVCFLYFPANSQNVAQVHVINVGQGSATLLEFPCGVVLIDTGGEESTAFNSTEMLMDYLDEFFQRRSDLNKTIDILVISHPHKDHTAGIREIVENYRIKNVVTNGQRYGSGRYDQVFLHQTIADTEATPDNSDDIIFVEAVNDSIQTDVFEVPIFDGCSGTRPTIKLLWGRMTGNPGWSETKYMNNNNHSVVARVDYGQASILFTGDLEEEAIGELLEKYESTDLLDTDVYVVGHHGSKNGTTAELIEAVTPEIAVLSFGSQERQEMWTAWAYGHPNKNIVSILEQGCSKTRTPKQVMVGTKAKKFTQKTISKAVYGTGWDEHIVLQAKTDGTWTYVDELGQDIRVNINTADVAALEALPSIGPARAQAIVDYRRTHGNFTSIEDLDAVPGIGPATIVLIRSRITI